MYIKNGVYKVLNHKEYHKIPEFKQKRIKNKNKEKIKKTVILFNGIGLFSIGYVLFSPIPINLKLIIIILIAMSSVNSYEKEE